MKLQFKLALYNTLTKIAVILFTGLFTLLAIEKLSVNHIEVRLQKSKDMVIRQMSSNEIKNFLINQPDYNILNQEYVLIKPIVFEPNPPNAIKYRTAQRVVDNNSETYRILSTRFNFKNKTYLLEIGESTESVEDLKTIIKKFTLVVLVIALALTLASDLIFTKYLLNPFYKIIDRKLIKVNDPLNFDYEKVKTSTQDFNLLDDSISSLMKKITDLFLLEKQFIANVSHELLTPISIISSRLENLMLQENLSEEAENKLFASLKTLNRLKSIINSLLLISKVENNQFNKSDSVKITDVLTEIIEELEDRLEAKQIVLNNNIKYQYTITGNRPLVHTLLFNIINNAVKYNYPKGTLTIADQVAGDKYILTIIDSGVGMEPEQIEKAFNRFEKLESDEMESFGLGLAIVKSIATFHHISIDIRSNRGKGTAFTLTFNS
ncbi:sensor histidine kinase [Mucilaginibacter boryungensis]|uniref:histidine kinase n=1 Tax=Mucilaginibacter boryungensis TaxID=768480 RepID=A0ABR9XD25_9SPHI|nr:HAMP domain-containing sensor histidine kinase [Mucilaginibacter boryungensis]MBE9665298.1 HAMP domain-containing histidine kinase [Mucilaginibacter boryungensis]